MLSAITIIHILNIRNPVPTPYWTRHNCTILLNSVVLKATCFRNVNRKTERRLGDLKSADKFKQVKCIQCGIKSIGRDSYRGTNGFCRQDLQEKPVLLEATFLSFVKAKPSRGLSVPKYCDKARILVRKNF